MKNPVNFGKLFLVPIIMVAIVVVIVGAFIIGYGEALLHVHDASIAETSFRRPEIWVAAVPSAIVVIGALVIAYSPAGWFGWLEKGMTVGRTPIFAPAGPNAAEQARQGTTGTVDQVAPGYTLFVGDDPLGQVIGQTPGNYLYATGFHGGPRQLWIPHDAIDAVYPDSRAAFVRSRGGAIPASWASMPANLRRS